MTGGGLAIGVMCKPPRAGLSKTRLAAHIGAENAARLAAAFLQDVGEMVASFAQFAHVQPYALYRPTDAADELRPLLPDSFCMQALDHEDLGLAMHTAITHLLNAGHPAAILIGADLPTLPASILADAVRALSEPGESAVIGPALDGGYYLIGLKAPCEALFKGMRWSTADVYAQTLGRARAAHLAVDILPRWGDVDDAASLSRLREALAADPPTIAAARHTRRALHAMDGAKPGRVCPLDYVTNPAHLAREADFTAETLYVVGGLYGNAFALDAIEAMARAEPGPVTIVLNGDAHWFDAEPDAFRRLDARLARYPAICGNVERELGRSQDAGAGCGCAYPESVEDGVVERSNAILSRLGDMLRGEAAIKTRLAALPKTLCAQVANARIAIVHGDAWSIAGWRFAREDLETPGAHVWLSALRRESGADIFACTHTCEPVMRRVSCAEGCMLIANNGAAGMANFRADLRGLITRIGPTASPFGALYGDTINGVHVEALPVAFDHAGFVTEFDRWWPAGSPAAVSYRNRIVGGGSVAVEIAKPLTIAG